MTDDEREADEKAILNALYDSRESFSGGGEEVGIDETAILVDHVPEIVLGLGFRRSEVPEQSAEVDPNEHTATCDAWADMNGSGCTCHVEQGEPSDAAVRAAQEVLAKWRPMPESVVRDALRAAGGVR